MSNRPSPLLDAALAAAGHTFHVHYETDLSPFNSDDAERVAFFFYEDAKGFGLGLFYYNAETKVGQVALGQLHVPSEEMIRSAFNYAKALILDVRRDHEVGAPVYLNRSLGAALGRSEDCNWVSIRLGGGRNILRSTAQLPLDAKALAA